MLTRCLHHSPQDILRCPIHEDGPQEQPPSSPSAHVPLPPRPLQADRDEIWDPECIETFELEGLSDQDPEPDVSIGNNYDEDDLSEFVTRGKNTGEEKGLVNGYTALGLDSLATGPMNPQYSPGDVQPEISHPDPESPNTCAQSSQASGNPTESIEHMFAQSRPGNPANPRIPKNKADYQPPSIFFSDAAIDDMADGNPCDFSKSYNTIGSPVYQIGMKRNDTKHLYDSMAAFQENMRSQYSYSHRPNNYEIATHDRQPTEIPDGIGPHLKEIAADSLNAFCADADLTAADDTHLTDTSYTHGKRCRSSGYLPTLQTPRYQFPSLQHRQKPPWLPPTPSACPDSLQIPTYPTPPPSFRNEPRHQFPDSTYTSDNQPLTQATPSRVRRSQLPSPIPILPFSLPDAAESITHCPDCPKKVFKGTPQSQKNSLQRHKRDFHDGMPRLECLVQECTVTFAPGRKDNLLKHFRAKHSDCPLPPSSTKRKREAAGDLES